MTLFNQTSKVQYSCNYFLIKKHNTNNLPSKCPKPVSTITVQYSSVPQMNDLNVPENHLFVIVKADAASHMDYEINQLLQWLVQNLLENFQHHQAFLQAFLLAFHQAFHLAYHLELLLLGKAW